MGIVIVLLAFVAAFTLPSILIFRTSPHSGIRKAMWALAPLVSFALPMFLFLVGLTIATNFFGYERTFESTVFGVEATLSSITSLSTIMLPWLVYLVHEKFYVSKQPKKSKGSE